MALSCIQHGLAVLRTHEASRYLSGYAQSKPFPGAVCLVGGATGAVRHVATGAVCLVATGAVCLVDGAPAL